jgi:hypothetical protein
MAATVSRQVSTELQYPISFLIPPTDRSYKYQYANIYFLRLTHFKPILEKRAHKRWNETAGHPTYVDRVLDVVKGKLSYIIGTVYVEMKLKPNVLDDIAKDVRGCCWVLTRTVLLMLQAMCIAFFTTPYFHLHYIIRR